MANVELLAPAKDLKTLQVAIQNGCDAVYIGGKQFSARAFANNFDLEDMEKGVQYAHNYGVRVYVTINTLIKQAQFSACINYIAACEKLGVDAIIVQDLGLCSYVRECFVDLEVHASTQMHIQHAHTLSLLKEMGVKRAVLARECSLAQIRELQKVGLDLEVFVQGALCLSYSGLCLMSAMSEGRSGNQGECAQSCRMQYELFKMKAKGIEKLATQGDYLLSMKDLNTIELIPQLMEAGVRSFKIEGRMKRLEYVATNVDLYRKAIDAHEKKHPFVFDQEMRERMQLMFYRGYSNAYLKNSREEIVVNEFRPNHMGVEIGEVVSINKDKVGIRLHKNLRQGDGIRILHADHDVGFHVNKLYVNKRLQNSARASEVVEVDGSFDVDLYDKVVKTTDIELQKSLQGVAEQLKRRVFIQANFIIRTGQKAILKLQDDNDNIVVIESEQEVQAATSQPMSNTRILQQLRKSKDTIFELEDIKIENDNQSFLAIQSLNQMRRDAFKALTNKRLACEDKAFNSYGFHALEGVDSTLRVFVVIASYEQFQACKNFGIDIIFVDDAALYDTLKNEENVFWREPKIKDSDATYELSLIQELGSLKANVYCDASLYVSNIYSAIYLLRQGAKKVCLSSENSLRENLETVDTFYDVYPDTYPFMYLLYGRRELMLSKHCPLKALYNTSHYCEAQTCKRDRFILRDRKKRDFLMHMDKKCLMHIYDHKVTNDLKNCALLKAKHISPLCEFYDENYEQTMQVLYELRKTFSL